MKTAVQGILLCSLLVSCQALYWRGAQAQDYSEVEGCLGGTVRFDWGYTLNSRETVEDIKWHFTDQGGIQHLIAMETERQFAAVGSSSVSSRLRQVDSAGLELRNVRMSDSGRYTVTVSTHDNTGDFFTATLNAFLNVSEAPYVRSGVLEVSLSPDAVDVNSTGQWHLQLKCGYFYNLGQPPVSVVWTTPSGRIEQSDSYENGRFTLLLSNPVEDGEYMCNVSQDYDPAAKCLPSYSSVRQGASVEVDGVSSGFTLLQAQQTQLLQDGGLLQEENNRLNHTLHNLEQSVESRLTHLEEQVNRLQHENQGLQDSVSSLERNRPTTDWFTSRVEQLERTVASLSQKLQGFMDGKEYFTTDTLTTTPTTTSPYPTTNPWWYQRETTVPDDVSSTPTTTSRSWRDWFTSPETTDDYYYRWSTSWR